MKAAGSVQPRNPFMWRSSIAIAFTLALGCSSTKDEPDAGVPDARQDAPVEQPRADASVAQDGASADATVAGDVSGDSGEQAVIFRCPTMGASEADLRRCTSAPEFAGTVGSGPKLGDIVGGAVSPDGASLYVLTQLVGLSSNQLSIFKIDLTTGNRTLVSGFDAQQVPVGTGPPLGHFMRITPSGTILVNSSDHLLSVDPNTRNRTVMATWDSARSDLCRFVEGPFDIAGDSTFYFGHTSGMSRGWLRYDRSTGDCVAVSWCRMSTAVEQGGQGPCPRDAPRPLLLHDGFLWSADFVMGAIFKVNPQTALRQFVSRTNSNAVETVGGGNGCLRVQSSPFDGSSITFMGGKLWISGDVVDQHDCDQGTVDLVAVDPSKGDRTPAFASAGPLAGEAGELVTTVWAHPSKPGVLLVAASGGVALYDPASRLSVYLSR